MLTALSIRDVVLIETLDLEFGPGLGVLTGETGAGKSILLDALGLALGARADSGLVRQRPGAGVGQRHLRAPGRPSRPRAARATTASKAKPGEPLVIRRIVRADGGSRAFVNDQSVSAGLLRELGALLVEIHGQHDDRGLLNPRGHRALLDAFGRIDSAPGRARPGAPGARPRRRWPTARERSRGRRARPRMARTCRRRARPARRRAGRGGGARRACAPTCRRARGSPRNRRRSAQLLEGSEGGLSLLRQAARRLDRIAGEHDRLAEALAALDRAVIEAAEAEDELERGARGAGLRSRPARRGRDAAVRDPRDRPQAPGRARRACRRWPRSLPRSSRRSRPARSGSPRSKPSVARQPRRLSTEAAPA